MLAHSTQYDNESDVPQLPCSVCIEAASETREGKEFVPAHALKRYTFDQLAAHLENEIHNQQEFVAVALRASIYLYRQAFADAFEEI
jgi:hypothetical protein